MENYGYEKPVSDLLHLGGSSANESVEEWIDYVGEYGFTSEHIPELQRLFEDKQFQVGDFRDEPEGFAFVHVLRVLGQLKDDSTIPFLFRVSEAENESDWTWDTLSAVLPLFGVGVLPKVIENFRHLDKDKQFIPCAIMLRATEELLKQYPELKQDIYDFWMDVLKDYQTNDYSLNATIIVMLSTQRYKPALPLIEEAFKAQRVDELVMGDYYDVLVEYGLEEADPDRKPEYFSPEMDEFRAMAESLDELAPKPKLSTVKSARNTKKKKKAKRKQAKKSQRKNRKRK
jgi:hypothetical protein